MIPQSAKELIACWGLGYVASADSEGRVNLSPKGTFLVLDDTRIAFAEMRSPQTIKNIAVRPEVEVNFVDSLSRKGFRVRGRARAVPREDAEFAELQPPFAENWSDLADRFRAIVVIEAETVKPISSPAYDAGADETELRQVWGAKIQEMWT